MGESKAGKWLKYPQYRDTGLKTLCHVPSHWAAAPLKYFGRLNGGAGFPDDQQGRKDGELPFFKVRDLSLASDNGVLQSPENFIDRATAARLRAYIFKPGTVVFAKVGAALLLNRFRTLSLPACIDNNMMGYEPGPRLLPAFAHYALTPVRFNDIVNPGAVPSVNEKQVGSIPIAVPTIEEQRHIIAYLDRECVGIDCLIAKQERLIELSGNKRHAVISKAVRKGLDTAVTLKESGIPWLGTIPAHWSYGKTRHFARLESGHTPSRNVPAYWENCTIPWFSLGDVWQIRQGSVDVVTETKEKISELGMANSAARLLPAGTVMLSRTASVGFAAVMGVPMATTQDFANWTCGPKLRPHYLLNVFRAMRPEFDRLMVGSTHQTIYMPDIIAMFCPLPPVEEQDAIVAFIKEETAKIDALIAKCRRAIDLLREHRASLISAVVTGKVRVTEAAPQPEELAAA